jgi:futalosine hydrolase
MSTLVVTSVPAETRAVVAALAGRDVRVVTGGIGRTNAAAATTEAIMRHGPFDAVLGAGVAGALPTAEGAMGLGEVIVASSCVYAEEGMRGPAGFADMTALGLPLGDFTGNTVPVDPDLLDALAARFRIGPVATVATCSGTDEAAAEIARRTGALAEAMEGAAVVHAARRLGHRAVELRVISNTTGDRPRQRWDLPAALAALGPAVRDAVEAVAGA